MSSGLTKKVHKMNYNPALDKATKNGNNRSSRNHPFDADEMEERQMNEQWAAYQDSKAFADRVATLYGAGEDVRALQKARYGKLVERFEKRFGGAKGRAVLLLAPGRTEIGGNHTDHKQRPCAGGCGQSGYHRVRKQDGRQCHRGGQRGLCADHGGAGNLDIREKDFRHDAGVDSRHGGHHERDGLQNRRFPRDDFQLRAARKRPVFLGGV